MILPAIAYIAASKQLHLLLKKALRVLSLQVQFNLNDTSLPVGPDQDNQPLVVSKQTRFMSPATATCNGDMHRVVLCIWPR
jgi:hypothetical protein